MACLAISSQCIYYTHPGGKRKAETTVWSDIHRELRKRKACGKEIVSAQLFVIHILNMYL